MKNLFIVATSAFFLLFFYGCTKPNDTNPQPPNDPSDSIPVVPKDTIPFIKADFSIQADCNASYVYDTLQNLFAPLLFINRSDAGKKVHYHWSFGDNTFSDSVNPTHTYTVAGTYPVQLITYYDTIPKDTITRLLRIIIGQKGHAFNRYTADIVDADNAPDDGAMVLIMKYQNNNETYALLRTDSLLDQVYLKDLPATSTRLNSLQKTKAGNYILSGNYINGNTNQYALSLINADGDLVWQNYLNVQGKNYFTTETSDGGLLTIGDEVAGDKAFTTIVKCNGNGNEIWRQTFNTQQYNLYKANRIIETSSGYVFAALHSQSFTSTPSELVVTELNLNGAIAKRETISFDQYNAGPAVIAHTGDTYLTWVKNIDSVYRFDKNMDFVNSASFENLTINNITGYDNHYYIVVDNSGGMVLKSDNNGDIDWLAYPLKALKCTPNDNYLGLDAKKIIKGKKDNISVSLVNSNSSLGFGVGLSRISSDGELR